MVRRAMLPFIPAPARPLLRRAQSSARWMNRQVNRAALAALERLLARRRATSLDVYFAYRLLLGRPPDAEGFLHHRTRARRLKLSVAELIGDFLDSEEFERRQGARSEPSSYEATPAVERTLSVGGLQVVIDANDHGVGRELERKGGYEPFVTWALQELLTEGSTFVDVGANIGYFTLLAARRVGPKGRVLAFEPMAPNHALLTKSVQLNGFQNVELFPVALGDADGVARFGLPDRANSGSFTLLNDRAWKKSVYEVPIRRLDDIAGDRQVDVIKMDVEGAEGLALRGMLQTLRRCRPVLLMEYTPSSLAAVSGSSGRELLTQLANEGYEAQEISSYAGTFNAQSADALEALLASRGTGHLDLLLFPRER